MVTLARPPTRSSLKITNSSFRYMLYLVYGTNFPLNFPSLVGYSLPHIHHHLLHTWQFIIFTITTFIFSHSFSLSFWPLDLALCQILSTVDLFLVYRTDFTNSRTIYCLYSAQRLDLFAWCVRLSRLVVGFRTHLKNLRSFIHSCQTVRKWRQYRTPVDGRRSNER